MCKPINSVIWAGQACLPLFEGRSHLTASYAMCTANAGQLRPGLCVGCSMSLSSRARGKLDNERTGHQQPASQPGSQHITCPVTSTTSTVCGLCLHLNVCSCNVAGGSHFKSRTPTPLAAQPGMAQWRLPWITGALSVLLAVISAKAQIQVRACELPGPCLQLSVNLNWQSTQPVSYAKRRHKP